MKLQHDLALRIIKGLNILSVSVPFIICWSLYYGQNLWRKSFHSRGNYVVYFLFIVLYCVFARIYDAFLVSIAPVTEMLYSQALSVFYRWHDVYYYLLVVKTYCYHFTLNYLFSFTALSFSCLVYIVTTLVLSDFSAKEDCYYL